MEVLDIIWLSFKMLWNFVLNHLLEIIGLLLAYFSLIVPIRQYLNQKELEEKDKRFLNYHRLIKEFVGSDGADSLSIERQIAIVFEFRNYPEYYEVTERILLGLLTTWKHINSESSRKIKTEINLTLDFIRKQI